MKKPAMAFFTLLLLIYCKTNPSMADKLILSDIPIIDAHSQVDHNTKIEKVIPLMDKAGVVKTILSTRFNRPSQDIIDYARLHPDRIIPSFKSKTKAFMKGWSEYKDLIEKEDKNHKFGAMAEVILYHAHKGKRAGKAIIKPDSERAMTLLNIARKHKWPFIFHIEFASAGRKRTPFMQSMEKIVEQCSDHYFGIIHMGQLRIKEVKRLVNKHNNLFFIMSHSNPVSLQNSRQPWTNMFNGYQLKPDWETLIISNPDQFVIAFDNVFPEHWGSRYLKAVKYWRAAMAQLPEEVAHAIAHKNAERLWKLPPAKPAGAFSSML